MLLLVKCCNNKMVKSLKAWSSLNWSNLSWRTKKAILTSSEPFFRSVVIDAEEVDTYSINEIDERVIQARLEAEILEATTQELLLQEYPSDCCPESYYLRFPCLVGDPDSPFWQGWGNLRIKTFRLIENKYFETAVIAMILISSLALVSISLNMI